MGFREREKLKKKVSSKMHRKRKTVKNETGDVTVRNAVVNNPTHGDGQSDINVSMKNMTIDGAYYNGGVYSTPMSDAQARARDNQLADLEKRRQNRDTFKYVIAIVAGVGALYISKEIGVLQAFGKFLSQL